MKVEELVIVDENDRELGIGEKIKTHQEGILHRAFSIFVFDDANRLLLQKRAKEKYHSGGLWSNTCCGHPRPGENLLSSAHRRLREEMNFDCDLHKFFTFLYRIEFDNNLIEHEIDHVFIGKFNGTPLPEKSEVEDWKWIGLDELKDCLQARPEIFSYWLRVAFKKNEWQDLKSFMDKF